MVQDNSGGGKKRNRNRNKNKNKANTNNNNSNNASQSSPTASTSSPPASAQPPSTPPAVSKAVETPAPAVSKANPGKKNGSPVPQKPDTVKLSPEEQHKKLVENLRKDQDVSLAFYANGLSEAEVEFQKQMQSKVLNFS